MNTCKATLRVLFSHRAYLLIYLVFVGIMMLSISWSMLSGTSDSAAAAFEPAKMRVAVIDRDSDRGGIASSMRTYLSDSSELVNVDDASETLQQAVASNWVDLIVIIPDGFADDFIDAAATGENPPRVDTVTSYTSGAGSMARMNVSGFLSLTRTALIGSHTTVDSAALAAMAGIDIGDTAVIRLKMAWAGLVNSRIRTCLICCRPVRLRNPASAICSRHRKRLPHRRVTWTRTIRSL